MSNRFVSGGTIDSSGALSKDAPPPASESTSQPPKSKEWELVQQELEAERKRRDEARAKAATSDERSLYDILQANKAAKQEAFEEASKVRNQFRALDDDEIDFLDEVRAKKRDEERKAKKEIEDGLKAFREAQKGDTLTANVGETGQGEEWSIGRKRKRVKEREVKGVRRKGSEVEDKEKEAEEKSAVQVKEVKGAEEQKKQAVSAPVVKKSLGLVSYGSDSDDDDD